MGDVVQYDRDISAYTVEKTMDMENRIKTMRELHGVKPRPSLQLNVTAVVLLIVRKPEKQGLSWRGRGEVRTNPVRFVREGWSVLGMI